MRALVVGSEPRVEGLHAAIGPQVTSCSTQRCTTEDAVRACAPLQKRGILSIGQHYPRPLDPTGWFRSAIELALRVKMTVLSQTREGRLHRRACR
jgi:hypothetical protein